MFLVISFLRLIHTENIIKEFSLAHHKENENQFHGRQGRGLFSQEMTKWRHNFNADICNKAVDFEFCNGGGFSAEVCG